MSTKGLCWAPLQSMSFHVNFLLPFPVAGKPQAFHKAKSESWQLESSLLSASSGRPPPFPCHPDLYPHGYAEPEQPCPPSWLLRVCRLGQAAAAFLFPAPCSWLNILPVSSPAVLGCCSQQPLPPPPPFPGKTSSLFRGLSLEPPPQPVTFTAFSSPYQAPSSRAEPGKGLLEVPHGPETGECCFRERMWCSLLLFNPWTY